MDSQSTQTSNLNDPAIAEQAQNLTKAIFQKESGLNYNAVGDAGTSHGAGQWQPETWKAQAGDILGDPNAPMTPENQSVVAQGTIRKMIAQGKNAAQIAATWNSGSDTGWENKVGVATINGQRVPYNVPQYVKDVTDLYQHYKNQSVGQTQGTQNNGLPQAPQTPQPLLSPQDEASGGTPQPQDDSLGTEIKNRFSQASSALSQAASGQINPLSGILQTVGAGAGTVGDVIGKGLEFIPGVKQVENLIGQGAGELAKTPVGQSVAKEIQSFSQAHPELAGDIGAGFNIETAIPIFKGLSILKSAAGDAVSQGLRSVAEKSFVNGAPDLFDTKSARAFVDKNPDVFQNMVDRGLIGDIQDGQYVAKDSAQKSWKAITAANNNVDEILSGAQYATPVDGKSIAQKALDGFTDRNGNVIEGLPNSKLSSEDLIANASKLDANNAALWDRFANGETNLQEINKLRQSLDRKVRKAYLGKVNLDVPDVSLSKERGALLAGAMRDTVQGTAKETQPFYDEMQKQFKIQKALEYMNGKAVKPGGVAKFAGHVVGMGTGAALGSLAGAGPTGAILGGLVGDRTAGAVAKRLAGRNIVQGILKRTGQNAVRTPAKKVVRGVAGVVGGTEAQNINR